MITEMMAATMTKIAEASGFEEGGEAFAGAADGALTDVCQPVADLSSSFVVLGNYDLRRGEWSYQADEWGPRGCRYYKSREMTYLCCRSGREIELQG
jgi:hypothetical protein